MRMHTWSQQCSKETPWFAQVRGAPLLAMVSALGLAVEALERARAKHEAGSGGLGIGVGGRARISS